MFDLSTIHAANEPADPQIRLDEAIGYDGLAALQLWSPDTLATKALSRRAALLAADMGISRTEARSILQAILAASPDWPEAA